MGRTEIASEFSGILHLLREHSFLKYSIRGRREYDQRLSSATVMFANLVSRATGLALSPPPPPLADLDKVTDGSFPGLVRTVRRVAVRLRRTLASQPSAKRAAQERSCLAWEKAAEVLAGLRD